MNIKGNIIVFTIQKKVQVRQIESSDNVMMSSRKAVDERHGKTLQWVQ